MLALGGLLALLIHAPFARSRSLFLAFPPACLLGFPALAFARRLLLLLLGRLIACQPFTGH